MKLTLSIKCDVSFFAFLGVSYLRVKGLIKRLNDADC